MAIDRSLDAYFIALEKVEKSAYDVLTILTQEAGVNQAVGRVDVNHATAELGDLKKNNALLCEAKKKEMLKMVACTWQADFIGEKVCILLGGLIKFLVLGSVSGEDASIVATSLMTSFFFAIESITDSISSYVLVVFYKLPLHLIHQSSKITRLALSSAMGFMIASLVSCMWMSIASMKMAGTGVLTNSTVV